VAEENEGGAPDGGIQEFILSRELAEVYLLLDNISSTKGKDIPDKIDDPVFGAQGGAAQRTWLEQICDIAWPPDDATLRNEATNAAKLIRAKDALNEAAAPATGASIAFTLLMSGEARDGGAPSGFWRNIWSRHSAKDDAPSGAGQGVPPSRASLAALAYPSNARRAPWYRLSIYALLVVLIAWLIITCLLSWDIATGSSLLNRANAVKNTAAASKPSSPPDPAGGQAPPAPPNGATHAAPNNPTQPNGQGAPKNEAQDNVGSPGQEPANTALNLRTADNLRRWLGESQNLWLRDKIMVAMGGAAECAGPPPAAVAVGTTASCDEKLTDLNDAIPRDANLEWASVFIGVLAGTVLPIFYGLLGASAAAVRMISTKMRDSTLMPRDVVLAYVNLGLGAVIGACVGLFVTSDGNAAQTTGGLLGSVHLSASALCFVAGFGVEGVFLALESLVTRVFNVNPAGQSKS